MAAKEEFPLKLVLQTVDKATAGIQKFNANIDAAFKPYRTFNKELGKLSENLGLPKVSASLSKVGSQVKGLALGVAAVGVAAVAASAHFLTDWIQQGDQLGDTADRIGLTANALAQLRFAAKRSGVEVEEIDNALEKFSKNLGDAKANTGSLKEFLGKVSPALLKQVTHAKSNEQAFNLMADAMAKVKDPAKRAALAQAVFGRSGIKLVSLLGQGSKGIETLRQRYRELAGDQTDFANSAGGVDDAMKDLGAAWEGVKARIGRPLFPVIEDLIKRLTKYIQENQDKIGQWAKDFADKLPEMIKSAGELFDKFKQIWDAIGGAKGALLIFAGVKLAPLAASVIQLTAALAGLVTKLIAANAAAGAGGGAGALGILGTAGKAGLVGLAGLAGVVVGGAINRITGQTNSILDPTDVKARSGYQLDDGTFINAEDMKPKDAAALRSHIQVDFANAPRGTRVQSKGDAEVDLGLGFNMMP